MSCGCLPLACDCGITDTFDRTVVDGLGVASSGPEWMARGTDQGFSVVDGVATLATDPDGLTGELRISGRQSNAMSMVISCAGTVDVGLVNGVFVGSMNVFVAVYPGGTVELYTPAMTSTTVGFDVSLPFSLYLVSDDLGAVDAYLWQGGSRPGSPTLSGSGASVPIIYNSFEMGTFGDAALTIAQLTVDGVDACTYPLFDSFARTSAGPTWGTATPSGAVWTGGGFASKAVSDVETSAAWPSAGGGIETHAVSQAGFQTAPLPFAAGDAFVCTFEFVFDQIFGSPILVEYVVAFGAGAGANTGVDMRLQNGATTIQVVTAGATGSLLPFTFVAGTTYLGEFRVANDLAEFRVWAISEPRPTSPFDSVSMSSLPLNGTDMLVLASQPFVSGAPNVTWDSWMHSIDLDYPGRPCYYDGSTPVSATPTMNQPVQDEYVGLGDGVSTVYTTRHAYDPRTLEVEVDGYGVDVDPSDWRSREFTLLAPTSGAIVATYRAVV